MTRQEVEQLQTGDEIFWNDPDNGITSRYYVIQTISINEDDVVTILDNDGSVLQCFPEELE